MLSAPAGGIMDGETTELLVLVQLSVADVHHELLKTAGTWTKKKSLNFFHRSNQSSYFQSLTWHFVCASKSDEISFWRKVPAAGSVLSLNLHVFRSNISNK